jgi:hypothetical protein
MDMPDVVKSITDLAPAAYATFSGHIPSPAVIVGYVGSVAKADITENDVLLRRGSNLDRHNGNVQLRCLYQRGPFYLLFDVIDMLQMHSFEHF